MQNGQLPRRDLAAPRVAHTIDRPDARRGHHTAGSSRDRISAGERRRRPFRPNRRPVPRLRDRSTQARSPSRRPSRRPTPSPLTGPRSIRLRPRWQPNSPRPRRARRRSPRRRRSRLLRRRNSPPRFRSSLAAIPEVAASAAARVAPVARAVPAAWEPAPQPCRRATERRALARRRARRGRAVGRRNFAAPASVTVPMFLTASSDRCWPGRSFVYVA